MAGSTTRSFLDRLSNIGVLVLCVAAVFVLLRREFATKPSVRAGARPDVFHPDWHSFLMSGTRMGLATAPVQLIELADFQCPGCGLFYKSWEAAKARFGDSVALTYLHFPLPYHQFALQTATAAECANAQGRFPEIYGLFFAQQDSIGLKSLEAFAWEAKIADSLAFRKCVSQPDTVPAVRRGIAVGRAISLRATPTILVNGLQLGHAPTEAQLLAMIERVLAGKALRE